MTTTTIAAVKVPPPSPLPSAPAPAPARFRFPDPPEREIDESMTNHRQMTYTGHCHHLARYLGNEATTLVTADRWIARGPRPGATGLRRPDLLVAFDVDPQAYHATRGYLISEQGKPPDFVLEVASPSTAKVDVEEKPADYAGLGILEYWRFDETGDSHGVRLAGDRLVDGQYEPIPIEELPDGSLQGYSPVLNVYLRWEPVQGEQGMLGWYDPETGQHIPTFDDKHEAELQAVARAEQERAARLQAEARVEQAEAHVEQAEARVEQAETRAEQERSARRQAEAEVRALRERLRLQGGG